MSGKSASTQVRLCDALRFHVHASCYAACVALSHPRVRAICVQHQCQCNFGACRQHVYHHVGAHCARQLPLSMLLHEFRRAV